MRASDHVYDGRLLNNAKICCSISSTGLCRKCRKSRKTFLGSWRFDFETAFWKSIEHAIVISLAIEGLKITGGPRY